MSNRDGGRGLAALNLFDDDADTALDTSFGMDMDPDLDRGGLDVSLADAMGADGGTDMSLGLRVSPNRTDSFDLSTGQFRGPDGAFEPGGPPPDFSESANRFRSFETGQFKDRPADHFDEPAEVLQDSLDPRG